jgi:hypothetical protein
MIGNWDAAHPEDPDQVDGHFFIVDHKSGEPAPPGYLYLASQQADGQLTHLILPAKLARRVLQQRLEALEHRRAMERERQEAEKKVAPKTTTAGNFRRNDVNHVGLPPDDWLRPDAEHLGVTRVWAPEHLREAIESHNNGTSGSQDERDRARAAAVYREQVRRGPWRIGAGPADAEAALRDLEQELGHVAGGKLVDAFRAGLAASRTRGLPFRLPPTLLVGGPGVGKTWAARRLAELMRLPLHVIDATSMSTTGVLCGSNLHWATSALGVLTESVLMGPSPNGLIVLDEVDKISQGYRHDPAASLLPALEPESASRMRDNCLPSLTFDASHVTYIATANSLEGMPAPLLSRFQEVLHCAPPTPAEQLKVAGSVWRRATSAIEPLAGRRPPRDVLRILAEFSPRRMTQILDTAIGRMLAEGAVTLEVRHLSGTAAKREWIH